MAGVGSVIDEVVLNVHEAERRQHPAAQQVGAGGDDLLQRLLHGLSEVGPCHLHAEGRVVGVAILEVRHEGRCRDGVDLFFHRRPRARRRCQTRRDRLGLTPVCDCHSLSHVLSQPGHHGLQVPVASLGVDGAVLAGGLGFQGHRPGVATQRVGEVVVG